MNCPEGANAVHEPRAPAATIVLSANSCWNIVNFRSGLIRALRDHGYRVVVAAPEDEYRPRLAELGAAFADVQINSAGVSVAQDLRLFARYLRVLRQHRPVAYLGFTAKPNIYGSLAARAAGARTINNISGLGTVFIKPSVVTTIVAQLYRVSLRGSSTVFFQNRDDLALFVDRRLVRPNQADLLAGSGIDVEHYKPGANRRPPGPFRFLLVGRLLWDKGVAEYVDAARLVRKVHPEVVFQVLGPAGVNNRTAVPIEQLERWQAEGVVEYLGASDDVRAAMAEADCIVLPSYREGLPKSLLEGSAMGKPLIGTDVPGCRDVIAEGKTGFLCQPRSAQSLADVMARMVELPEAERSIMGAGGRRKVEQEYCESRVIAKYLAAIQAAVG